MLLRKYLLAFVGQWRERRYTKEKIPPSEPAHAGHGCLGDFVYLGTVLSLFNLVS